MTLASRPFFPRRWDPSRSRPCEEIPEKPPNQELRWSRPTPGRRGQRRGVRTRANGRPGHVQPVRSFYRDRWQLLPAFTFTVPSIRRSILHHLPGPTYGRSTPTRNVWQWCVLRWAAVLREQLLVDDARDSSSTNLAARLLARQAEVGA